jgi:hypothetical protein
MKNKTSIFIGILALLVRIIFLFSKETRNSSSFLKINNKNINIEQNTEDINVIEIKDNSENIKNSNINISEIQTPEIQNTEQPTQIQNNNVSINKMIITTPLEYNIENVKFFSQAPLGIRDQPYQDACEEASLLI